MQEKYDNAILGLLQNKPPGAADLVKHLEKIVVVIVDSLKKSIGIPVSAKPFLVADGQPPKSSQLTESDFVDLTLRKVSDVLADSTMDLPILTQAFAIMNKVLSSLGNAETVVRLMLDLEDEGAYDAADVANDLANTILLWISSWRDAYDRDVEAEVWNAEGEAPWAQTSMSGSAGKIIKAAVGPVERMPNSLPSSGELGNRVHRYVQEAYFQTFPHHLVLIEEGWRVNRNAPPPYENVKNFIASLSGDDFDKANVYLQALVNWVTLRRWKPDIADLADAPPETGIIAPWGWFEIKHWKDALEGFFQLGYYRVEYSTRMALKHPDRVPEWLAFPGGWIPPPVMMNPRKPNQVVVITRPLPGVIIYYVFDANLDPDHPMHAVVMIAVAAQLARAILNKLWEVERFSYALQSWIVSALTAVLALVCLAAVLPFALAAKVTAGLAALLTWLTAAVT